MTWEYKEIPFTVSRNVEETAKNVKVHCKDTDKDVKCSREGEKQGASNPLGSRPFNRKLTIDLD